MNGVIIAGGSRPSAKLIAEVCDNQSMIVCADSGANTAYEYGLNCKTIVGDFDSINKSVKTYFQNVNCDFVKYSCEKDYTDTELAINFLIEQGVTSIKMLGCTGTRIDHLMANIGLLVDYSLKGYDIELLDDNNRIRVLSKDSIIEGWTGKLFSVQSFREDVKNLCIEGAKYPLNNYDLKSGSPLTVSNVFEKDMVHISFYSGILLLIYPCD